MVEGSREDANASKQIGARERAARLGPRFLLAKALLLGILAMAGAALARVPGIRSALGPLGALAGTLQDLGWAGVPLFVFGATALIAVGIPRLVFCPLAGAAYGFWAGLAWSTVATMMAYFGTFLFLRGRLADRPARIEGPSILAFLRFDPGIGGVVLTRLLPIPGLLGTIALSLSPVRKRAFLVGSLVGLVPEAVPLILLGAGMLGGQPRHLMGLSAGAVGLVVVSWLLIRRLVKRYRVTAHSPTSTKPG